MSEKYVAISSLVGFSRRMCDSSSPVPDFGYATELSECVVPGIIVAARGVLEYRSCSSVRPSDITGVVAYIGTRVKSGKCLQQ